jgi:hypothetical protein
VLRAAALGRVALAVLPAEPGPAEP